MKPLYLLLPTLLSQLFLFNAGSQTVQWAKKGISQGYEYGNAITTDDLGNVYVSGQIEYTTNFDGPTLSSYGSHDFFAGKFAPDGSVIWLRSGGGIAGDVGYGVGVDASYNTYITGEIEKTAYITSSYTLTANASNDIVAIKYNQNGLMTWAKSWGSEGNDKGMAMAVTPAGDCFITGYYSAGIDFGNIHLSHSGSADVYVLKLNSNGNVVWAKRGGGSESDRGHGIAYDKSGNVYVTGYFTNSATFSGTTISNNQGVKSAFLAKYDSTGSLQWIEKGGDCCNATESNAIAIDANENIYTVGYYDSHTNYGGVNLNSAGNEDVIITKYDPSGSVLWSKSAGGPYEDIANGISIDTVNQILYVTGQIDDHGYFGTHYVGAAGNRDVFIAAYDLNGNCLWAKPYGGNQRDIGYAITNDRAGNIFTTGIFYGNAQFGPITLNGNLLADFFVDKVLPSFAPIQPPMISSSNLLINQVNCNSLDLSFTPGDGMNRIVVAREGSPVSNIPANGISYSANSTFGFGDTISNSQYVVYNGIGNSLTINGLTTGSTYYFTVFEYNGTGNSTVYRTTNPPVASSQVSTNPLNVLVSSNNLCAGDSATLTVTGAASYSWTPNTGLSIDTGNTVTAFPSVTTTYSVSSQSGGCMVQRTVTININPIPSVNLSLDSVCIDLGVYSLTGGTPAGGIYSGNGIQNGNINTITTGLGTFPVTYAYTDVNGCSATDQSYITVLDTPAVTFSTIQSVCSTSGQVALTGGNPSGGNYSGTGVMNGIFDPLLTGAGTFPITYTYTGLNGCSNSVQSTINVLSAPSVIATNFSTCLNSGLVSITGGSPAGGVYSGNGISNGQFDPSVTGPGTFQYNYTYTDNNGCNASSQSSVDVLSPPIVSNSDITTCLNSGIVTLSGGTPAGGNYSGPGISNGQFDPSITGPGTFSFTYSYTDINGCSNSFQSSAIVNNSPPVTLSLLNGNNSLCLNSGSTIVTGGTPAGGIYSGPGIQSGTFDPAATGTGSFTITYTYTDSNGCTDVAMSSLAVVNSPSVYLGPDTTTCADNAVMIDAGVGFNSYQWSTGAVTPFIMFDTTGHGLGVTTVLVEVTDNSGCTAIDSIDINFDICAGISSAISKSTLIYPNPFTDYFNLSLSEKTSIKIFDSRGRLLDERNKISGDIILGNDLASGLYFLEIVQGNNSRNVIPIIKE